MHGNAFRYGLPFHDKVCSGILTACLIFFAFTTILGWSYYSERCLSYLFGGSAKVTRIYRFIYIAAVFIGPYLTVEAVWNMADIFNGLMAIPNVIALILLSGTIAAETKGHFANDKKTPITAE